MALRLNTWPDAERRQWISFEEWMPRWPGDASGDKPGRGVLSFRAALFGSEEVSEGVSSPGGEQRKLPQPPFFCFLDVFSYISRPNIVGSSARDPRQNVRLRMCVGAPNRKKRLNTSGIYALFFFSGKIIPLPLRRPWHALFHQKR